MVPVTSVTVGSSKITITIAAVPGQRIYVAQIDWTTDLTTGIVDIQGGADGVTTAYALTNAAAGVWRPPAPLPVGQTGIKATIVLPCTTTGRLSVWAGPGI
jgi:hypothetical protein